METFSLARFDRSATFAATFAAGRVGDDVFRKRKK
jgi:hypothetical protein